MCWSGSFKVRIGTANVIRSQARMGSRPTYWRRTGRTACNIWADGNYNNFDHEVESRQDATYFVLRPLRQKELFPKNAGNP